MSINFHTNTCAFKCGCLRYMVKNLVEESQIDELLHFLKIADMVSGATCCTAAGNEIHINLNLVSMIYVKNNAIVKHLEYLLQHEQLHSTIHTVVGIKSAEWIIEAMLDE